MRSSLVARDFKPKGENVLLRHDSPASSSMAAQFGQDGQAEPHVVPGNPAGGICPMNKWLDAARAWVTDYTHKLAKLTLKAGESSAVAFHSPESEVVCVVHGDDFTLWVSVTACNRFEMAWSSGTP